MRFRAARWSASLALGLALFTAFVAPRPVAAECTMLDPWPSFTEATGTAKTIVIGQVVESLGNDSAGNAIWFRVRTDEVLRGTADPVIEIKHLLSGVPLRVCDESILRVRMNDRIALAFDAQIVGVHGPVTTVAWVREGPAPTPSPAPGSEREQIEQVRDFMVPGVERLSVAEVRALAAIPATDSPDVAARELGPDLLPVIAALVAGALGGSMLLARIRRQPRSPGR